MPALHIEDLPEKEKLKMEVEQLRKEVKLQRQQAAGRNSEEQHRVRYLDNSSLSRVRLFPKLLSFREISEHGTHP
ncbi:guanine nucleotide-binding protein G(I)/G(S)/G(O) subunit gamma-11 isoform X1 [Pongo abelii]|uniref:guanine nucleotide-binding protein G(I)/G(S)/G(O) subunit gamma-11 isoform X1 n=1 Tax=Pongo abelii TaxID=9601 RepID=UPI0004F47454